MIFVSKNIINKFKRGDQKAFAYLYDKHYDSLYLFGMGFITDKNIVEDMLQEAFIKVWDRRTDFDDEMSFKAFLYSTIRNACLNILKHEKVKSNYVSDFAYKQKGQAFYKDNLIEQELSQIIKETINKLPPSAKEIYLLGLEGLKNKDIAEDLGVSVNTVKTQKQRASKFVRKTILKVVSVFILVFLTLF